MLSDKEKKKFGQDLDDILLFCNFNYEKPEHRQLPVWLVDPYLMTLW